jgi:hypothetical protein
MFPPTHTALGYLTVEAANRSPALPADTPRRAAAQIAFSLVMANLPDVNFVWAAANHRQDFFHYPAFWLLVYLAAIAASFLFGRRSWRFWINLGGLLILSHLLLDTLGYGVGISWLWPLRLHEYNFLPPGISPRQFDGLLGWSDLVTMVVAGLVAWRERSLVRLAWKKMKQ